MIASCFGFFVFFILFFMLNWSDLQIDSTSLSLVGSDIFNNFMNSFAYLLVVG